jgi:two-component sensor histidine kinase
MRLTNDEHALTSARRFARTWSNTNGLDTELSERLELLVSELVTNAIRHGAPPFRVDLRRSANSLYGEVGDGSRAGPEMRSHPDHEGGFGLRIVDTLTSQWGVSPTNSGKTVWFEIDADSAF